MYLFTWLNHLKVSYSHYDASENTFSHLITMPFCIIKISIYSITSSNSLHANFPDCPPNDFLFIYLAASDLGCGMQDLCGIMRDLSLQCMTLLVMVLKLQSPWAQ